MATSLALTAIVLWSFLAYFGVRFTHVPSLLAVGLALCIGGTAGIWRWRDWRIPLRTLAVGVGGIFGYHFLYFSAFQHAPAVEVNLLNYLWPLLIVLLTPLVLPGYRLQLNHLAGAGMGLAGAILIVSGGSLALETAHLFGYLQAIGAALIWALYSLLTKRLPPFSTGAVSAFCLVSGVLSLAAYWLNAGSFGGVSFTSSDWALLPAMGLGPMGLAFYAWDAALKRGDPRKIGSLSYLTPLLSTLNLVLLAGHSLSSNALIAMALIVAGAIVGALEIRKPNTAAP